MSFRLTIVLTFLALVSLQAQPLRSTLLQRLYEANDPIPSIYTPALSGLFPDEVDKRYSFNKQYLVKTSRQLLLGIAGTGLLYELTPSSTGIFHLNRVDSTLYAGNNFCSANFVLDSIVYSFGGYGFWKTNGTLKQFNPYSREWDVIPLLEERPSTFCQGPSGIYWKSSIEQVPDLKDFNTAFAPSFFWVDHTEKLFFMGAQHMIHEGLFDSLHANKSEYNTTVSVLDINKKRWNTLGNLLKYGWHYTLQLPWGLLVIESPESIYVADFKANQLYYVKNNLLPLFRKFFKNVVPDLFFFSNGYVYLGSLSANSIDSIAVKPSDFMYTGEALFKKNVELPVNSSLSKPLLWIGAIFIFFIIVYTLVWIRKKRALDKTHLSIAAATIPATERLGILNETEIALIQFLVAQSVKGRKTTIEEVNKLAGVAQKNEPIRRRVRSELINSINEKWIIISGSRNRLIASVKSNFDGRIREYHIFEKWLSSPLLIELLKNKSSA